MATRLSAAGPIVLAACLVALSPGDALASDFSFLANIVRGIYIIVAAALAFVCVVVLTGRKSPILRGCVWGSFAALVFMPVYASAGNGDGTAPPLYHLVFVLMDGDPEYLRQCLVPLLVGIPAGSVLLGGLLMVVQARLPNVAHKAAIAGFQRAGFEIVDESDRVVMSKGTRTIAVPKADPVDPYTMGGLVLEAGLSLDEFKQLL